METALENLENNKKRLPLVKKAFLEVKEKVLAQAEIDEKLSKEFFFRALAYGFTDVCVKSAEYWIQAI